MPAASSALEILLKPAAWTVGEPSMIVLAGDEPLLAWHMLALLRDRLCPDEADRSWAWREFDGTAVTDPRDVFDEAATVPLFASATRVAVVRGADPFVSTARVPLENLASAPRGSRGLVVLDVKTFPATTRLAKAVAKHGLLVETTVPPRANLAEWVRQWAQVHHGCLLAAATAQRLVERLGSDLGQIDQAVARLAAATAPGAAAKPIPPEAVDHVAGSSQERTAWSMIDAASGGDARTAISQLAELIDAGENPIALNAQAASVLKRLSTAARLLALPAQGGRPAGFDEALRQAGVAAWPKALGAAREALLQLGSRRARQLPLWLLEIDRALKGDASRGLRARLALERLFCKMVRQAPRDGRQAGPASGAPASGGSGPRRTNRT